MRGSIKDVYIRFIKEETNGIDHITLTVFHDGNRVYGYVLPQDFILTRKLVQHTREVIETINDISKMMGDFEGDEDPMEFKQDMMVLFPDFISEERRLKIEKIMKEIQ